MKEELYYRTQGWNRPRQVGDVVNVFSTGVEYTWEEIEPGVYEPRYITDDPRRASIPSTAFSPSQDTE